MAGLNALTTAQSLSSELFSLLNLNGWQLQNGKYNGCTFLAFTQVSSLENSGIGNAIKNATALTMQLTKSERPDGDKNGLFMLYNTFLMSLQFTDTFIPNTVVKQLPNGNKCNIESLGSSGYSFAMSLIFLGTDYQKAIQNFENAIKNPPNTPDKKYVLEHPTRGKIKGITKVTEPLVINTAYSLFNGAVVNVIFRTEESDISGMSNISDWKKYAILASQIISSILALINSMLATAFTIKATILSLSQTVGGVKKTNSKQFTQLENINKTTQSITNSLLNCTDYIYKKSEININNSTLDNHDIDNSFIPKALSYGVNYNTTQGDIIVEYYNKNTIAFIDKLKTELGGNANDLINQLNESMALLYQLTRIASIPRTSYTYLVPYDMSIREVLAQNSLPFSDSYKVINNNPNIKSANLIPSGTRVAL